MLIAGFGGPGDLSVSGGGFDCGHLHFRRFFALVLDVCVCLSFSTPFLTAQKNCTLASVSLINLCVPFLSL